MNPHRCAVCTQVFGPDEPVDVVQIVASYAPVGGIAITLTSTVATCTERHDDTSIATARAAATAELARALREACLR